MPVPPVNSPFDSLMKQVQTDLIRAAELCEDIKKHRHVGKHHKNLDELEEALSAGPDFVRKEAADAQGLPGADPSGGDEESRETLNRYVIEMKLIGSRLESIAHPSTHQSRNHHHHQRSLFFPIYVPPPHKAKEDPHFHDLTLQWISIRNGIMQMFAAMKLRLAKKVKVERDAKDKIEKDQKDAPDKADKEKAELQPKI